MKLKERVLEILELNKEDFISGEEIAEVLGVSRSAVWKAIRDLKQDGYELDAVSNRGYRLNPGNDILSAAGISAGLSDYADSGNIFVYDSLESTNKTAKEMAISGAEHGTVVVAGSQTLGKGRSDHSFYSPEGGLYMSIILSPSRLSFTEPALLTAYIGVNVCEALEKLLDLKGDFRIKWVNDIFYHNKKICGILTESGSEYETGDLEWIVVGIGLNFNSDISLFPKELQKSAGALFDAHDKNLPITKNELAACIIKRLLKPQQISKNELMSEYKSRLLYMHQTIHAKTAASEFSGTAVDVDQNLRLIVKKADGSKAALSYMEASINIKL